MGYMSIQPLEISEIMTETSMEPTSLICEDDEKKILDNQEKMDIGEKVEKKFITSPADIDVHRKVELQDALIYLRNKDKLLETYVQNLRIYFHLIQVI